MADRATIGDDLERALSLMLDGRHAEAYDAAVAVAEAAPGEPRAWEIVGTIALEGGRPELAYQAFTNRRGLAEDETVILSQVTAAYHAIDMETALEHAREAVERWPDSVEARAWIATLEALDTDHDVLLSVGRTLYREGRYDEALDVLVAAMEAGDSADAYLWLGRAFLATGDVGSATILLEAVVAELGDDPTVAVDLASAFAADGRRDIARAYLDEARRLHPDDAEVAEALARLDMDEGAFGEALGYAHAATQAAPGRPSAWITAAGAFEATGRLAEARLAVDRAIALDSQDPTAWALGARVVERGGDAALATRYRAAVGVVTGEGGPKADFAPLGDLAAEIEGLYALIRTEPAHVLAYRDRATLYRLLGEHERALYYLDLVVRDLMPEPNPGLLAERGGVLLALGRTDDAVTAFREALALDAGFAPARAGLAAAEHDVSSAAVSGPAAFCSKCGSRFTEDAEFCSSCGARRS